MSDEGLSCCFVSVTLSQDATLENHASRILFHSLLPLPRPCYGSPQVFEPCNLLDCSSEATSGAYTCATDCAATGGPRLCQVAAGGWWCRRLIVSGTGARFCEVCMEALAV